MFTRKVSTHISNEILLLLALFALAAANVVAIIPKPQGKYGVSLTTMRLTDKTRIDPFSPDHQLRSVMVSAFYPIASANQGNTAIVDYMPPATAAIEDQFYSQYGLPNGTFETLKLSACEDDSQMAGCTFPVVLFSPGLGNSRLLYNAIAQSFASSGYIVVTIDHPYDSNVVEYPDGILVLAANISSEAQIELDVNTRAGDVSFVLDQLSLPSTVSQLLPWIKVGLRTDRVAIYGHSLGGATAAAAMLGDERIIGGANLDGTFFGSVIRLGLKRPFLVFGHEGKNQSTDPSWAAIWPKLHGFKLELMLHGAQHATFSDLPFLVKVLGLTQDLPAEVEALLGTLDGARALEIVSSYLVAFFDFALNGRTSGLLQGPTPAYPEVSFVAKGSTRVGRRRAPSQFSFDALHEGRFQ